MNTSKSINRAIKILISSDIIFQGGWGLIGPIFAIFLVQRIAAGDPTEGATIAGFASLTYWITKSLLQIPIGSYLDKNRGEKDDLRFTILGTFLTSFAPLGFLISSLPLHIYIFQAIQGIGMAMVIPSWSAIFTRHIDKDREAFEWSLRSTSLGFSTGIAGAVGGILVTLLGFKVVFILAGSFSMAAAFLLLLMYKEIIPEKKVLS